MCTGWGNLDVSIGKLYKLLPLVLQIKIENNAIKYVIIERKYPIL